MRLNELNLSFIENELLQQDIDQFVDIEQKKLREKQNFSNILNPNEVKVFSPVDELLKDTLFLKEENTETTTINPINQHSETEEHIVQQQNYIEYHEDEFNELNDDWVVDTKNEPYYLVEIEQSSFDNHDDRANDIFIKSDAYTYPRDYYVYNNAYIGFVYAKVFSRKEFFLPCVLTEDCRIKYLPEHKDKWNDFCDYLEIYDCVYTPNLLSRELFILTEHGFFQQSLQTEDNIIFNTPEQIKPRLILKEEIEKENNYIYLKNKYNENSATSTNKKLKI